jgi:hypothetical protein
MKEVRGGDTKIINNYDRLADLFHFASLVNDFEQISPTAQSLLNLKDSFVIFNAAWSGYVPGGAEWNHENAQGVSISLPRNPISFYTGDWLEFGSGADWSFVNPKMQSSTAIEGYNWGPMISDLVRLYNPDGEDDPLPPDPLPLIPIYGVLIPMLFK